MNRREFLEAGLSTAAVFSLSGLTFLPRRAEASTLALTLVAEAYDKPLVDGTTLRAWRFRDPAGSGPGALTAGIAAMQGDSIEITLINNLTRSIRFAIPGFLTDGPELAAGETSQISFTAPAAGTYLFHDDLEGELGLAMGLSGPMVILPAGGAQELYPGGPSFDRQYTLVLADSDDRLNAAIAGGQGFDLDGFEPNYFFANGLCFPDTAPDADTRIVMTLGERVAIRFVNAGLLAHPMHFHGYHVEVATHDRVPETTIIDKDTVLVGPGQCVDVILPVTQAGAFPLHTHFVPGVTANGVYVNPYGGALIILEAS